MFKKTVCIGMLLLMSMFPFFVCSCGTSVGGYEKLSPFKTALTAEEHVTNITWRTIKKFVQQLGRGDIKSYSVEILWSFDENPEYFLIEFEDYISDYSAELFENAYIVGYIVNDVYYQYYYYPKFEKSPFKIQNADNEKKYYGFNVMAVKEGEEFLCVNSSWEQLVPNTDFCEWKYKSGMCLSESDRKYLATHDYRMPQIKY